MLLKLIPFVPFPFILLTIASLLNKEALTTFLSKRRNKVGNLISFSLLILLNKWYKRLCSQKSYNLKSTLYPSISFEGIKPIFWR